ncbi:hypothetical protein [Natronorubrum texcoconense]|uniref:Uncharacterized protein n=1 Tax=Natronorubrum texcoconense TaxID=1095776 RepID=A0A1G9H7L3_9EURY|nr:hypothetical protein [Natronorubrum texcoconense]SDL08882.1 hypothetical protein SAMN04515672_0134 [Natronorubrum texcoconense]
MATDHSHGLPADTTDGRSALTGLREACETVLETALRPTSIDVRARCQPDGEFLQVDDKWDRKTWRHQHSADRVQLTSSGLTGHWSLEHQTGDGRFEIVASGLEREDAYARAEQYMADLAAVEQRCRSGRAAD